MTSSLVAEQQQAQIQMLFVSEFTDYKINGAACTIKYRLFDRQANRWRDKGSETEAVMIDRLAIALAEVHWSIRRADSLLVLCIVRFVGSWTDNFTW